MSHRFFPSIFVVLPVCLATSVFAVSVEEKSSDPSPAAEQSTFQVHPDFEVNLFADETLGIANPIAMHWDSRGRLWVLTTLTYAQLEPGENPNDKLFILEDIDGDGRADKSTVFADGLNMPMGFALGHGGVFLGEGSDLLFLTDTDGDDRADTREVLLTGFGQGDTHQNISNFTWGPDGCLYFSQGLHCYSLVETPWGIVRGDTAGFWRLNPVTLKLDPFCFPSLASQNPCGLGFDKTGALFVKSNNKELIYATPGLIPTTNQLNLEKIGTIGATPGKSMGAEYVDSAHLPDWLQNNLIISGYYAHEVCAFPLKQDGAGYAKVEPVELMVAGHSSFRPVETRVGPDGAIYIADWFNPIIGHYQASLRHPDRDVEHGRIWRMTAKGRLLNDRKDWNRPETIPVAPALSKEEITALIRHEDPRKRLDGIIAVASRAEPGSLPLALEALDSPLDPFLSYSLEQTVHALAPSWLPAAKAGSLTFSKPEHLSYALLTLGGPDSLEIARNQLSKGDLSPSARRDLASVIAKNGSAEDLRDLLKTDHLDSGILQTMADSFPLHRVVPAEPFRDRIAELLNTNDEGIQTVVIRLIGLWKVTSFDSEMRKRLEDASIPPSIRAAAASAYTSLAGPEAIEAVTGLLPGSDGTLRAALIEALVSQAPQKAVKAVMPLLLAVTGTDEAGKLLAPFLQRKGAPDVLAAALKESTLSAGTAGFLAGAMSTLGRNDESLLGVFHDRMGLSAGARAYSPDFIAALVKEVKESGNAGAGKEVYQRAQLSCSACHQLGGVGGMIGPSLDAAGAGLTVDLLIESVLWPDRQLKEGYFAIAVTTKSSGTFSGYREKEENNILHLRDTVTGAVQTIPRTEISKLDNIGTLMPPGLTSGLTREELRDLIAYLSGLKG
jgi:putative heme-binding domain-containing protein